VPNQPSYKHMLSKKAQKKYFFRVFWLSISTHPARQPQGPPPMFKIPRDVCHTEAHPDQSRNPQYMPPQPLHGFSGSFCFLVVDLNFVVRRKLACLLRSCEISLGQRAIKFADTRMATPNRSSPSECMWTDSERSKPSDHKQRVTFSMQQSATSL
jgi:hypothetical protein